MRTTVEALAFVYLLPYGAPRTVTRTIDKCVKEPDGRWRFKHRASKMLWTAG